MRWDGGRHADRDALRAIGEQIGERRRQNHRLLRLTVIARAEIDGILIESIEQQPRDLGHPRFGITVGGCVIPVDVPEIALPVDQGIPGGKILGQTNEGVVDGLVAMGVEVTHDVADDLRRFLESSAGIEPQQPHPVEDAAMHRF